MTRILTWPGIVEAASPYVVKILSSGGQGTGFLLATGGSLGGRCLVATAAHVIKQAHDRNLPIRIEHPYSGSALSLFHPDREVIIENQRDRAAIIFDSDRLPLPTTALPLAADGVPLDVGQSVCWLGFPHIAAEHVCFFGGYVSAFLPASSEYLVDGVSIPGLSGGPVLLRVRDADAPVVVGILTAYKPGGAEPLPGVAVVADVRNFSKMGEPRFMSLRGILSESPFD